MSEPLIRIEGVVKRYGAVTALAGVTLRVEAGEFIALLGPSGCGKTTLLRTIAGFVEPDAGEVRIDGRAMTRIPPNKRPVNTVFQNYALFPHMTVFENIAFGPLRSGVRRREVGGMVEAALATIGLEGLGDRYASQLSGGQQQRVALARAIVNRPKVLLLDEPLGALDLKLRKRMQLELKRLHERLGITFLYVTHDQEEALVMADRIAVMAAGRIIQLGTGEEIYDRPSCRYVADFVGEANLLDCTVDAGGCLSLAGDGVALPYGVTGVAAGAAVTLLARPESIDLMAGSATPGDESVTLPVTVGDRLFVGATVKIHALTKAGQEIVLQPRNRAAAEALAPGMPATIGWPQAAGRVLVE
jgi:spermidine/putrescine transport system ATP-binding protein